MRSTFRILPAALVALVLCAPAAAQQKANRAPGFDKLAPGARVAIMPADIELFEVSGGGIVEPRAEWTAAAQQHVRNAYRLRKEKLGLKVTELEDDASEPVLELNRLHNAVAGAIASHHFGLMGLPTKEDKLDWSLGPGVSYVREKTGADYAIFTFIRDSYLSEERKAAMVIGALFGVGIAGGQIQFAFVSLVDLKSGQVVWANRVLRATGDLRTAEPAQETVDAMLTGLIEQAGPPSTAPRPRSIRDW
ncbi:MAG: hypothetical protein AB1452_00100 [Pseudomonadota bacterium]